MHIKIRTVFSAACGLLLPVLLLFALNSITDDTQAAAPADPPLRPPARRLAEVSNGTSSRPLVVPLDYDPNLDFHQGSDFNSLAVSAQLMEGLYRYQPDGNIEPAGAVTYAVSPNGTVYTVSLRTDARWSDGEVVTAQQYVDGIIRLLDPNTGADLAFIMYPIQGAEDFNTGAITDPSQVGVTAVGPFDLRFTLETSTAHFPSLMATAGTYPARLDLIAQHGSAWTEPGNFVGNGPYTLQAWTHHVQLDLVANPTYHSAGQVGVEEVTFRIIPDTNAQLAAYENDQLDVSGVPVDQIPTVLADPVLGAEFHQTPWPGVYYLGLNTQLTPTNNLSVCVALASAIDRSSILTDVLNSPWKEGATSVIPPSIPGHQNREVGHPFDPTQAQAALAAAGYPGGVGLPEIELWANSGQEHVVDAVANDWRTTLGITVTTFYTDFFPYLDLLDGCPGGPGCTYNAYRLGWIMDYADASNLLSDLFHPDNTGQYTGWDNARYRELISMTLTETNQVSRTLYFQEADQILVEEETAVIPLFFYDRQTLVKADVRYEYVPFGGPHYADWQIVTVATATIPTSGGSLSSPDGDVTVAFPDGALAETGLVTYTQAYSPAAPIPYAYGFGNHVFQLDLINHGDGQPVTTFAEPVTITIDYTEGDLGELDETKLELRTWNSSAWVNAGITVVSRDTANNRLMVRAAGGGRFALFGRFLPSRPLAVGLDGEPNLDFHRADSLYSFMVSGQLMESLFQYAPDGSIEPAGAETYTISADGLAYTVSLRTDARWSDGQSVVAQHYVDGVIRLLDPNTPDSWFTAIMQILEGGEEYYNGTITDPQQVGVTAVGTFQLRFDLKEVASYFPSVMATPATYPARLDLINQYGSGWTEPGNFVGNGAYVLAEWVHDDHLVVEKNPTYHGAGGVTLREVTFQVLPDIADQLAAYENDQLDVSGVPQSDLSRILTDPVLSAEFYRTPQPGVYYLGLNTQLTPTNNLSVCVALASAIDRSSILTDALGMPWREKATSVIPPGIPGYQNEAVGHPFNPTQAQAALAAAGYPGGAGLPEIELWANSGHEHVVDAVADDWRTTLGITVTTFYTDFFPYLDLLDGCPGGPGCTYNAYRLGWIMDYADANNILNEMFHPDNNGQYTGWDNARYRELISMTLTETNHVSRTLYFQEADQILVEEETAVIPLFFYDRQTLVKADLLPEYIPFYWGPFFKDWRLTSTTTATVSSSGGSVSSPDGDVDVEFPDGGVAGTSAVTYTAFYLPPHPTTGTFSFANNGFVLEVTDLSSGEAITNFSKPVTITIEYTDGDVSGLDEDELALLYWDGTAWVDEGITIVERDTANNRVVVTIDHLSEFALFGPREWLIHLPLVLRSG